MEGKEVFFRSAAGYLNADGKRKGPPRDVAKDVAGRTPVGRKRPTKESRRASTWRLSGRA